ncbi:MBL fold metallo-hydrolase [Lysobacter arvi]|uniref:MBL fold metallo-hydrolase n=1 Tax=Lysobacter arvi TaxID=3038776 RepID=A0ABU1CDB8_9GAMM|nr:MBL fold metallo-hydrolase [Lysobacter arvi]MDR0182047.1 MBL fold metallo-hydrolase [Lysobacter arvi]
MLAALLAAGVGAPAHAAEPLAVRWNPGAQDCDAARPAPLQVHRYEDGTFLLRQNPCASAEANFLYLLIGAERALLIDSGAIADPARMPLAATVMSLLPDDATGKLPLIVAHTHSHRDHREGDAQFAGLPDVEIVPSDADGVRRHFGFAAWPDGVARIDLGGRVIDVLPTPGHNDNHVVFFDRSTGLLFTGDALLPGRITVDDTSAFEASARRLAAFARDRAVSHVLGGHVEMNAAGELYPMGSTFHPDERRLALARADVLALPGAFAEFNGFYSRHANYAITHPLHNLAALVVLALLALALLAWGGVRLVRRRRARRVTRAT